MITNSSSIITDGLILNIDASNLKSYKGPTIQNVLTTITPSSIYDNGSTYRAFSGTENVYIPSYGYVKDCAYVDWYNDYNGGSGNCCPNMYYYGGPSLSGNTVYTYGILYRSVNRYTNGNLMYHYEYGPSGYITEFGLHNTGYSWQETHLGNGWYWSRAKFTSNASTTSGNFYSFMYQYATWNRLYVAAVALMPGDFTNLHPKYWPTVGTTRSSGQSISNIANKTNTTIQSSNIAYSSNGTFSFNGSSSVLLGGDLSAAAWPADGIRNDYTVQLWFKPYAVENYRNVFDGTGAVNYGPRLEMNSSGNLVWVTGNSSGNATAYTVVPSGLQANVYHNVAITIAGKTVKTYYNGSLVTTTTEPYSNDSDRLYGVLFGRGFSTSGERWFYGELPVGKIYNRALSDAEIKQNFNALRERYGI